MHSRNIQTGDFHFGYYFFYILGFCNIFSNQFLDCQCWIFVFYTTPPSVNMDYEKYIYYVSIDSHHHAEIEH